MPRPIKEGMILAEMLGVLFLFSSILSGMIANIFFSEKH